MTTYTITTSQNIDELTAKAGGDTYNVNGGTLTIDQDSRYGLNQTTSASLGGVAISATLGGNVEIDARYVRLIPYNTGTGNVPASNTVVSQGSASGKLIGVYASLTSAPTAAAAAMPASGYIKVKQWNSVAYAAGALTGIGASATGADVAGWIELVGDEAATITARRLGLFRMRGEWYLLGDASGSNATTYQIPTNGLAAAIYHPGVWVETSVADTYEFYPCAGSLTATSANVATDDRGKVCWIGATTGLLRFGHDGTNSTGGYVPPAGRKIRMPNIFTANCTTAARTANVLPNATLATRYDFTATGAQIIIDKANLAWYPSFTQPYSLSLSNVGILEQLNVSELATATTWDNVGVGQCAAQAQYALLMATCLAGGDVSNCVWSTATLAATGRYVNSITDIQDFDFVNDKSFSLVARGNGTTGNVLLTRAVNCTWTNSTLALGRQFIVTCTNLTYTNTRYWDNPVTTTAATNPMYMFDLGTRSANVTVDGVNFGGLPLQQPYSGIMSVGSAGCSKIRLRNLGTAASPLDMGAAQQNGAAWTRSTTTATVTLTSHGLKTGDIIYCLQSSDITAITVGSKTLASAPTANTFTFTCLNAGAASGTLTYYPTMAAALIAIAANAVASDVKAQRCYTPHLRTNIKSEDNSSKGIVYESCQGDFPNAPVSAGLNEQYKMVFATHAMTAQSNPVYGTHWFDGYTGENSPNLAAQSWTRTTTTATLTSNSHGLRTGEQIMVSVSSSTAAIVLGVKTVTVTGANTLTFTCLNAGGASGTLTYENLNGRIGLLMNEASAQTATQYTIDSGTPSFTAAGGLYAPVIGQQITFEMPGTDGLAVGSGGYRLGYTGFPIAEAVMAGGTLANYDVTYAIDKNDGSGYSAYKNLYYPRAGGTGTSGQFTFTVTDATGVAIGDYVWGTGIAPNAKVTLVASNTVTVDLAHTATVSGVIRFNQLPSEAIATPANGFKLKIRIKTSTTNATAITSLYLFAANTTTSRGYQYPLDISSLTFTGLQAGSEVRCFTGVPGASAVEIGGVESSGTSFTFSHSSGGVTGFYQVLSTGYQAFYQDITYSSSDVSIPVSQVIDRNWQS